ncbi:methylmalonyl Co-A mutase-associated GTPase MeaB [Sediminibacillus massiliensis]|uniref:methylmalonyl Co-A mutase-associated GTPase MeaB n=1 Tax=Sediminibacillus massiliensis TaxID=1926277 RepID=UPI0009885A63|nr:methylmalonyl Co-A mutase-associated GTPase MeaB [Sediminibacillus massiliensis]
MHELADRVKNKDIRALARAITMVENDHPDKLAMMSDIFSVPNKGHFIGITGSPGAGKSSLVNQLIGHVRDMGLTIAVIAVDPSSPFSGGALLGDRFRMNRHFSDKGVFIRSMAARGSLGGLARATKDATRICNAYGFDVILVETVGVGQSELDVMKVADTTALVMTPNSGDVLQIFKAGIMEIADLFVINKADLAGVEKLETMLSEFIKLMGEPVYRPPIIRTISTENKGLDLLWKEIISHRQFLEKSEHGRHQRRIKHGHEVRELMREVIWREVQHFLEGNETFDKELEKEDPYQLASKWVERWLTERRK